MDGDMCDNNVLATKLDHLTETMGDLKRLAQKNEGTLHALHIETLNKAVETERRLTIIEAKETLHVTSHTDIDNRLTKVESIVPATKALLWVAGALGMSAIGLIWSILVGQIQIVIP